MTYFLLTAYPSLCVGPRRSLCRAPALSALGPRRSLCRDLCPAPALSVSAVCWGALSPSVSGSVSGPGAGTLPPLSLSGPGALSVLSVSGPGPLCVEDRALFVGGPGARLALPATLPALSICLGPALSSSLCRAPPLSRCLQIRVRKSCDGPPAPSSDITDPGATHPVPLRPGPQLRSACHLSPTTCHLCGPAGPLRSACHPSSPARSLFPEENPKPYCLGKNPAGQNIINVYGMFFCVYTSCTTAAV